MKKYVTGMVTGLKWAASASLACMMFLTCADVILRALGRPITGAVELVGFMAVVAVAGSLPFTHVTGGHASVDMIIRRLPARVRGTVDSITCLFCVALFAIIAWQSYLYAMTMKNAGEVSMTLGFPTYIIVFCTAAGFLALAFTSLMDVALAMRKAAGR
jgi:TRAP-type C4-dicarboxylate transport system permease small subunit